MDTRGRSENMISFVRVLVLQWADILAGYALWVMTTYLTDVWKLNFVRAASIVNVFRGAVAIMPIGMAFFVDAFMGDYWMLLLSSLSYSFGMILLAMSTPPVLSNVSGNCGAYKPDCIGDIQKVLFYTSLPLIAVGKSGRTTSLNSFLTLQLQSQSVKKPRKSGSMTSLKLFQNPQSQSQSDKKPWKFARIIAVSILPTVKGNALPYIKPRQFTNFFAVIFLLIVGGIALQCIKPWSVRFGIPAIFTVTATLLFMSGSCSYKRAKPQGSPLTTGLRVFIASASKMFRQLPQDADELFQKQSDHLRHTNSLRCLDKAAIVVSTQTRDQQEQNRWKLCRVTEVEETKIYIRMIPMWITFIMCGVVSSTGSTYFLEQADHMNRKVGRLEVPLPILLIFYYSAKSLFAKLYVYVANKLIPKKYVPAIGIVVAMLFSILCCITAAKVETRRLEVIIRSGLLEKPNKKIPMSMFWLLPQFLLLGALNGISKYSIETFFKVQAPASMSRYLIIFTNGVLGIGVMGGVLSVYIVGKISERGGNRSWFQDTLNKSRLDNYYWTLAALSSVNLVFYIFAAIWHAHQNPPMKDSEVPGLQIDEPELEPDFVASLIDVDCAMERPRQRLESARAKAKAKN